MTGAEILRFFFKAFTSLISIINPLGVMPVFIALTKGHEASYAHSMARKASVYMILVLAFFLMAGTYIMSFFGISLESIRIAGGLIVLRSGYMLLNPKEKSGISKDSRIEALDKPDISFTPLALPLLSGPGSIAATITIATQARWHYRLIALAAVVVIGLLSYLTMFLSRRLMPSVGRSGLDAVTKIMGFLSMSVGVQFIMNGLEPFLKRVTHLF